MVERLAVMKAGVIADRDCSAWVLGADTTVVLDGKILGKPVDRADAVSMLLSLQGRTHEVLGGIALVHRDSAVVDRMTYRSVVRMRPLDRATIDSYVSSGEPMDKAGSYAIQGIGASLVEEVSGSYSNVVGLNLAATIELLLRRGIIEIQRAAP